MAVVRHNRLTSVAAQDALAALHARLAYMTVCAPSSAAPAALKAPRAGRGDAAGEGALDDDQHVVLLVFFTRLLAYFACCCVALRFFSGVRRACERERMCKVVEE